MKILFEILESKISLAISGVCLALSLILSLTKTEFIFDPAIITVILSGLPLLFNAIRKLIRNKGLAKISSALLISIAMGASIYIGELFAAGEVAFIMAIGELLEDMTTKRAKRGLKKLMEIAPDTARKLNGEKEEMIRADTLCEGDIIRILPGEKIPADCRIIKGETSVDQSIVTGESVPYDKTVGDEVFCGTVNCFGAFDAVVTCVGENSSLNKLIRLIKEAEEKKAPMHRTADKWASILVPVALLIAIIAYFIPPFDIQRAVTVLVVFCPCALVLATPTAIMAAIGQATKHGVIIKSGEALENMGKVDTVAFDKTGTITYGSLEICDVIPFGVSEKELLSSVTRAETLSGHPISRAIVSHCQKLKIDTSSAGVTDFLMESGKGITASVDGNKMLCGNERLMTDNRIIIPNEALSALDRLKSDGKAFVICSRNGELIGIIALSDKLREDSKDVIEALSKQNVSSVLLTGDNAETARMFAQKTGIENVKANLLPEDKVTCIEQLKASGKTVCMIGDGVNDAPALKRADVGIAMGGIGSDIAEESSGIVLLGDDIKKLPYLKRLAKATLNTIKFSISLSLIINAAAIILSLLNLLDPVTGALVHNAGSCLVVLIAACLYDRKFI